MRQHGFTLLELLMVIAIIGLLAGIIVVAVDRSRGESTNQVIIKQTQEYQKALELVYSNEGSYPFYPPWSTTNNRRVICLGDTVGTLDCLGNVSYGNSSTINPVWNDTIHNALGDFMSSLPHILVGTIPLSSPGYHRCVSTGPDYAWNSANNVCGSGYYSIWFVLEGTYQDCGPAIQVDPTYTGDDELTLCRLQSQ